MSDGRTSREQPARMNSVLEEVISRRLSGEEISDDVVIERNRDLMPGLGERLGQLRRVETARRWAAGSSADAMRAGRAGAGVDRGAGKAGGSSARAGAGVELGAGSGEELVVPGYRIVREIHRGGQGVVYLAVQESTRREVAVKVLREGPFCAEKDRARFEREVQILAQFHHPNIVAIHDSGVAPSGRFFFVMDYIVGRPLDQHLAETSRGREPGGRGRWEERLSLFERICGAVHAAHLRGVIHRDLKPSNIRVDEAGSPHVLDFGLARVFGEDGESAAGQAELTVTGQFVGSLPWASPEQAEGAIERIDLRTDVYSLGVIFYQMLTGRYPYAVTGPMREVIDRIQREAPVRPRTIDGSIDADLETIALKCLAKEPERRYQSADEIGREIRRHRSGEPIEARRDSAWYVARKTLRRHWAAASVAAGFVAVLVGAALWLWVLYGREKVALGLAADRLVGTAKAQAEEAEARGRAEREAEKAGKTVDFLREMLGSADPHVARGKAITVVEVLKQAAAQLDEGFEGEPEVAAAVRRTIGQTYRSLGEFGEAEKQYRAAMELSEASQGAEHLDTLAAMNGLAGALEAMNRYEEAEALYRRCLEATQRAAGPDSAEAIEVLHNLGNLQLNVGRLEEAEYLLGQALERSIRVLGAEHADTLTTRKVLADLDADLGETERAEQEYRAVAAVQRRVLGDDSPETMGTLQNLGILLKGMGRLEEAEPIYREVVEGETRVHGENHPETLRAMNSLGRLVQAQGRLGEAEEIFRRTIERQKEALGEGHFDTLVTTNNLGLLLQEMGRLEEAEPLSRRVEEVGLGLLGDEHPDYLVWLNNLANLVSRQGKTEEAARLYEEVMERRRKVLGEKHPATLMAGGNLALALTELGRFEEAEGLARRVLESRREALGAEHSDTMLSMHNLGYLLYRRGDLDGAEALVRETMEARRRVLGEEHPDVVQSSLLMGRVLIERGAYQDALELLESTQRSAEERLPAGHWYRAMLRVTIGQCMTGLGRFDEAETNLLAGYEGLEKALGAGHPRLKDAAGAIVEMYEAAGRGDEAAMWRARMFDSTEGGAR